MDVPICVWRPPEWHDLRSWPEVSVQYAHANLCQQMRAFDQRIWRFFAKRRLTTSFKADSAIALLIASPRRCREA